MPPAWPLLKQLRQPYPLLATVADGTCTINSEPFHSIRQVQELQDTSLEKIMN